MEFTCKNCKMKFANRYNLEKHEKRKNICTQPRISVVHRTCPHCKYIFASYSMCKYHMNGKCKIENEKKANVQAQDEKLNEATNKINELLQRIELLEKNQVPNQVATITPANTVANNKVNTTNIEKPVITPIGTNNGTVNNNTGTINNNDNRVNAQMNILAYGKEDISHLIGAPINKALKKGFKSIPGLIEMVHFDKSKPENHNIYISNLRDPYVHMYDGEKWIVDDKGTILSDIADANYDRLCDHFESVRDSLDEFTKKKFSSFTKEYDSGDGKLTKGVISDIRKVLYNNRTIPELTKKNNKPANIVKIAEQIEFEQEQELELIEPSDDDLEIRIMGRTPRPIPEIEVEL